MKKNVAPITKRAPIHLEIEALLCYISNGYTTSGSANLPLEKNPTMPFTDAQIEHYKTQGYLSGVTAFQRKVCAASRSASGVGRSPAEGLKTQPSASSKGGCDRSRR